MAWRAVTRDICGEVTLNSRSRRLREGLTSLWVLGSDDTALREPKVKSTGCAAVSLSLASMAAQIDDCVATFTVTLSSTAGVPHQRGLRTSTAVPEEETDCTFIGPAERSTAGLKVSNPLFHPTWRA